MTLRLILDDIGINVSRETVNKLECYVELVVKWNPAINLVSKVSLGDVWARHLLDSAQLYPLIPQEAIRCVDLGSGGGFPGVVLAAISSELLPDRRFIFMESDQRKATFLREASRLLGLRTTVISERAESIAPQGANFLSARALAPLSKLIDLGMLHLALGGVCAFPKGATYQQELDEAKKRFRFNCLVIPSQTDERGAILKVDGIEYV